jgi:hypothetical protein
VPAVPKPPKDKLKKKKQNGYKNKSNQFCYYTGTPYAERHEVYGGSNRQTSIEHGFQVDLSPQIHKQFHNPQTEEDFDRIIYWRQYYQRLYEEKLLASGITPKQARKLWMYLIGKNYLEPVEEDD